MILQVPPGSPAFVRDAAAAILALHIGGGVAGVFSGLAALLAPKGGLLHRAAGQLFFVAMLLMSGIGTIVSPFLPNWSNVVMGLFVFYLVSTAWMTVRRPADAIGRLEIGGVLFAGAAATLGVVLGMRAAASPKGLLEGIPPWAFFLLASFPTFAGALDVRMILHRGLSGPQRIARHLWRMSVALFIASGSFFLGQPKLFPHWLRGSPIMFAPEVFILVMLVVWLLRTRSGAPKSAHPRKSGDPARSGPARNLLIEQRLAALGYLDNAGSPLSRG